MKKPTKIELKKYRTYLKKEAEKFKLTAEDLSNLYDLSYMLIWVTYDKRKFLENNF